MIVFDSFLLHESLYVWITIPLFAFVLVAADVQVRIRKQRGHLTQECIKEFIELLACGIECWLEDSWTSFDRVGSRSTAELRVAHQPTGAVTRNIKFRHNANSAFTSIGDN